MDRPIKVSCLLYRRQRIGPGYYTKPPKSHFSQKLIYLALRHLKLNFQILGCLNSFYYNLSLIIEMSLILNKLLEHLVEYVFNKGSLLLQVSWQVLKWLTPIDSSQTFSSDGGRSNRYLFINDFLRDLILANTRNISLGFLVFIDKATLSVFWNRRRRGIPVSRFIFKSLLFVWTDSWSLTFL